MYIAILKNQQEKFGPFQSKGQARRIMIQKGYTFDDINIVEGDINEKNN